MSPQNNQQTISSSSPTPACPLLLNNNNEHLTIMKRSAGRACTQIVDRPGHEIGTGRTGSYHHLSSDHKQSECFSFGAAQDPTTQSTATVNASTITHP